MVVKEINGVQTMLASYWDGGYVLLNVEDPANATYIGDTHLRRHGSADRQRAAARGQRATRPSSRTTTSSSSPPTRTSTPYRFVGRVDPGGAERVRVPSARHHGRRGARARARAARSSRGDTRFVGDGCIAADDPAGDAAARSRSSSAATCAFQDKVENAEARGYTAVVIFNNATRRQRASLRR